ncbi:diguanylate cyclase [Pseudonocardia humida]|uniref:Diguanylate cyclase n=1 Tax=Pseudonocardia humida TaxID=2800819 RepID=A0ABT1A0Q8_9PSEU|nr:diguanylate cyclase [Pseudonocardia humida]MCO1656474.1 diguanylate cyclase [Pseudonocardia humida]
MPARRGSAGPVFDDGRVRVWRTHDPDLGVLLHKEALGEGALERIAHEASVLRRLEGVPGVPRLRSSVDPCVLVAAASDGRSLAEALAERRLTPPEVLALGQQLAATLEAVHEAGVAHLGLHPGTVLLVEDGGVELVDFTLATMIAEVRPGFTHHREILGPLPYLSPEQTGRTGSAVDRRSDLYAVGAVLYEAATGRPPFIEEDAFELLREILTREPTPVTALDPTLPAGLEAVLARLLEKEPDRRYQSAAGLAHDLARVAADTGTTFPLGERDFPDRLSPPTQLIGRDREIAVLTEALDAVADPAEPSSGAPACRVVLVSGGPGVGKSALVSTLRRLVTRRGGWFVSGKADQVVRDSSAGLRWALRGLARLLLAEPPAALEARARELRQRLRSNASVLVAIAPEFAQVLGESGAAAVLDEREREDRIQQSVVDLLQVVASPSRPLVLFLDDVQWAPPSALDMLDAIVNAPGMDGLLLVGAYRDTDVDARLAAIVGSWERLAVKPTRVRLAPLDVDDLATLLEHVLRLPAGQSAVLAGVLGERTGGNPFDTIELLNSLRDDGALALADGGWTWDAAAVRHHVGRSDVVALLTARIEDLGPDAAHVLGVMACLGAEVSGTDLATACGLTAGQLVTHLGRPLAAGLVTAARGGRPTTDAVLGRLRFRHDRVQQAAFERLGAEERRAVQARTGWRLAAAGRGLHAARQLLAADVRPLDADERERVVRLYRWAADDERRRTEFTAAEQFLAAAARILRDDPATAHQHFEVESERHQVLYQLGRLDEADTVYASLSGGARDDRELAQITAIQVASLTNRHMYGAAVELGLRVLARLGVPYPEPDAAIEVACGLAEVVAWTKGLDAVAARGRPVLTDPTAAALAAVMGRLSPAAFFSAPLVSGWLVTRAQRLWEEHGPSTDLMAVLGHAPVAFIAVLDEYHAGEVLLTHLLATGEAHGWERAVAYTRFLHTVSSAHWFQPLDACVPTAKQARDGLLHVGDLPQACWSYVPVVVDTFETAPHLDQSLPELAAALALAERTGILPVQRSFSIIRRFCHEARAGTDASTSPPPQAPGEQAVEALAESNTVVGAYLWLFRSISAALLGDWERLAANSRAAYRRAQRLPGIVITLMTTVPFGLDLSLQLRRQPPGGPAHTALLSELDDVLDWLRRRAHDQPANVAHLVSYLEAERAWALGDHDGALVAFDSALSAVQRVSRPWHHALLARRAGELHRERGLEHSGRLHLAEAKQVLLDWGADAMAAEFDRAHPFLRDRSIARATTSGSRAAISAHPVLQADTIDTTAILRVAQALAAQTTMPQLHDAIVEQLRAITGATAVRVVLRDESAGWRVYRPATDTVGDAALDDPALDDSAFDDPALDDSAFDDSAFDEDGAAALVPVSAVRYVLRTREALAVDDATADDRFAQDPYLADEQRLALLVVPVLRAAELRAVLVLENRLTSGAFTTDRLGFVTMLTGQLAVALDNAQVYTSLERRIAERTTALRSANAQLELLSSTDALTGVANRRRFDAALAAEWTRSLETALPVSVLMVDVDRFKQYNDDHGHLAGDACLVEISRLLAAGLRDTDLLCRYGGEEFAAILPRADLAAAVDVAERMRLAVEDARLPHTGDVGVVTVSVGVASSPASTRSQGSELLARADLALYAAKRAGRNCVRTQV